MSTPANTTSLSKLPYDLFLPIAHFLSPSDLTALARVCRASRATLQEFPEYCFNLYRNPEVEESVSRVSSIFYPGQPPVDTTHKIKILINHHQVIYPPPPFRVREISLPLFFTEAQEAVVVNGQNFIQLTCVFFAAIWKQPTWRQGQGFNFEQLTQQWNEIHREIAWNNGADVNLDEDLEEVILPTWDPEQNPDLARHWWKTTFPAICDRPDIQILIPLLLRESTGRNQLEITQYLISGMPQEEFLRFIAPQPNYIPPHDAHAAWKTMAFAALTTNPNADITQSLLRIALNCHNPYIVKAILLTKRIDAIPQTEVFNLWGPDLWKYGLYVAAKAGHANIVRAIIDHPSFNAIAADGQYGLGDALCAAAGAGHANVIAALSRHRNFTAIAADGPLGLGSALREAAIKGHANVITALSAHPNFNAITATGLFSLGSALYEAAVAGHANVITALSAHPNFTAIPANGRNSLGNALRHAAIKGHADVITALSAHPNFNAITANNVRRLGAALCAASRNGYLNMVHTLRTIPRLAWISTAVAVVAITYYSQISRRDFDTQG